MALSTWTTLSRRHVNQDLGDDAINDLRGDYAALRDRIEVEHNLSDGSHVQAAMPFHGARSFFTIRGQAGGAPIAYRNGGWRMDGAVYQTGTGLYRLYFGATHAIYCAHAGISNPDYYIITDASASALYCVLAVRTRAADALVDLGEDDRAWVATFQGFVP